MTTRESLTEVEEAIVVAARTRALPWITVGLLAVIAAAAVIGALHIQRLVIEQQRTTCYERLRWISPGEEDPPGGVQRSTTARLCEGDAPVIEFRTDEQDTS